MPIMFYVAHWGIFIELFSSMAGFDDLAAWAGWSPSLVQGGRDHLCEQSGQSALGEER